MKEINYEEWKKNPTPRMMWVWDNEDASDKKIKNVVYITKDGLHNYYPVMTVDENNEYYDTYRHCAEIEQRRMTKQELAWWLRGNPTRELKSCNDKWIQTYLLYTDETSNIPVSDNVLIRENGGEWRVPLVEAKE